MELTLHNIHSLELVGAYPESELVRCAHSFVFRVFVNEARTRALSMKRFDMTILLAHSQSMVENAITLEGISDFTPLYFNAYWCTATRLDSEKLAVYILN